MAICNEFATLPPENQTSLSGLQRVNWSSWQSPSHRARLEGNAAPATPTPIPETAKQHVAEWNTWNHERSNGNWAWKVKGQDTFFRALRHETLGVRDPGLLGNTSSPWHSHRIWIKKDAPNTSKYEHVSWNLTRLTVSYSPTSIQLYVQKVCSHFWRFVGWHQTGTLRWSFVPTLAKARSIICSFSLLGCGKIQDDTTEIANLKKSWSITKVIDETSEFLRLNMFESLWVGKSSKSYSLGPSHDMSECQEFVKEQNGKECNWN